MASKYPNFAAEMARSDLSYDDVYATAADSTGKTKDTVSNWINGRAGELPITAAIAIRNEYFPTLAIEYLFSSTPG